MIYVISKSTFGDYHVRDIQYNANWDCCPYFDYALIPDNLVDGILATQGYCDITLNSDGTIVESFVARSIPSVPEECQGVNTVLSVNGVNANADGEVTLNAGNVGAIPQSGGDVNGYLDFRDTCMGFAWKTADGTIINLRPYSPHNVLQLTMRNPTNGTAEFGAVNIHTDGRWGFSHPGNIRNAIGAAPSDIYKFFPLSATTDYGWYIADALNVDTTNPTGDLNRPGYVYNGGTGQIPDGLSNGIREVFYYAPEWIIVKITGWDSVNYRPCVVYNQFRGFNIGWTGWEWENPPMADGVAYRTTERYKGNPVYAKAVELSLAGSGFKSVHVDAGITEVVSMEGSYYQGWGGVLSEKTVNPSTVQLNLASGSLQINSSDMSGTTAKYIVKYTK